MSENQELKTIKEWNELGVKIWNLWDHVTNNAPRPESIKDVRDMLGEINQVLNKMESEVEA